MFFVCRFIEAVGVCARNGTGDRCVAVTHLVCTVYNEQCDNYCAKHRHESYVEPSPHALNGNRIFWLPFISALAAMEKSRFGVFPPATRLYWLRDSESPDTAAFRARRASRYARSGQQLLFCKFFS